MAPPPDTCVNKTHFVCDGDQCLPRSALCDVFLDCEDGYDESPEAGCNGKVSRALYVVLEILYFWLSVVW